MTAVLPAFLPPLPDGWRWKDLRGKWFAQNGDVNVSVEFDNTLVIGAYGKIARVPMLVVHAVLIADARCRGGGA